MKKELFDELAASVKEGAEILAKLPSTHRFHLILPIALWERIKALALRNRRPITQEIIIAIEDHLVQQDKEPHHEIM